MDKDSEVTKPDQVKTIVKIWISFSSISDIDVVKQQFTAEFLMTATWLDPALQGKKDSEDIDWDKAWNPKIRFINIETNIDKIAKSRRLFTIEQDGREVTYVQALYQLRGTFRTSIGLTNFPFDYQELPIVLSSDWSDQRITLEKDMFKDDTIETDAGRTIQEWSLSNHVHSYVDTCLSKVPGPSHSNKPLYVIKCHVLKKAVAFFMENRSVDGTKLFNHMDPVIPDFFLCGFSCTSFFYRESGLAITMGILLIIIIFKFVDSKHFPVVSYPTLLDRYFSIHMIFLCLVALLNIIALLNHVNSFFLTCCLVSIGIFVVIQVVCGIISFKKIREARQVESKYNLIYQKRADEIERLRRERDWYAERSKMPKTPTIVLTPATARQFLFPNSNGGTPKISRNDRHMIDPTGKSYIYV